MSNRSTVRRPQLDERTADHLAETFKALSDRSRLRLIAALMGAERCVGELAADLAMSESAVSHQLRTLRQLRLVRVRKNGRRVFYALDDEHIEELFRCGLEHVRHG